ncbi:MAG: N-methyl-L-tryptophan oxidase, partial [Chloroflexota bacterium]
MESYDVIVVGLGAMGSATTYHLAKRGRNVLGLDMYDPGHSHGSSHGEHRMIRNSSVQEDGYVPLANRAFQLWRLLEHESSKNILKILGEVRLSYESEDKKYGITREKIAADPYRELLSEEELAERFPGFRLYQGMIATYEAEAGYLRPEVGIASHLEQAVWNGAKIKRPEEVTGWSIDGRGVKVETRADIYRADRLVITTGPWAEELLKQRSLPLTVTRIVNGYFNPTKPEYWKAENGAPNFLLTVPEGGFYGLPSDEGIGLKIGLHTGEPAGSARTVRREIDDEEIDFLRGVLDRYMPGASGPETKRLTCLYT